MRMCDSISIDFEFQDKFSQKCERTSNLISKVFVYEKKSILFV